MVEAFHRAIPPIQAGPSSSPYFVGGDPPPAPAVVKPSKDSPKIVTAPTSVPPLPGSKSKPHFTVPSRPATS